MLYRTTVEWERAVAYANPQRKKNADTLYVALKDLIKDSKIRESFWEITQEKANDGSYSLDNGKSFLKSRKEKYVSLYVIINYKEQRDKIFSSLKNGTDKTKGFIREALLQGFVPTSEDIQY